MTTSELNELTRRELADLAKKNGISGRHDMRKAELIDALHDRRRKAKRRRTTSSACRLSAGDCDVDSSDELTATPTDPNWICARWTLSTAMLQRAEAALKSDWHAATPVLRLFALADDETQAAVQSRASDIEIDLPLDCWFVPVPDAGRTYRLQLGYRTPAGRFFVLASSQTVRMPKFREVDRPVNENGGPEPIPDAGRRIPARCREDASGAVAISAEVTLHGETGAGALVVLNGKTHQAGDDGRFTFHFALEEGRQVFTGVCRDELRGEERTIVVGMERNTRVLEPQTIERFPASEKIGA